MNPVYAQNVTQSSENVLRNVIEDELEVAIISGDGTEDHPYIVDYSLAPAFRNYVETTFNRCIYGSENKARDSGFTGYALTQYQGVYSRGCSWVYSSGGLPVDVDGNLRITRISYASVAQAKAILQMRGTPGIWDVITEQVIAMNGRSYSEVVAMVSDILSRAGISSVGGCSAALLSQASAVVIGAVGTHLAATLLIASYVNLLTTSEIAYAVNSSKNFLNISYLTSYHGAWYQNSSRDAGWTGDRIYVPSSIYGTGTFSAN